MIAKDIKVGEKIITFGASGDTPRRYRLMYGEDVFNSMDRLTKGDLDMGFVENLAFIMAKQANPNINENIDEWLDQFEPMDLYRAAHEIIGLWVQNMSSTSRGKKK